MNRALLSLSAVVLLATRATQAEPALTPAASPAELEALAHFGVTTAPFDVPALREAKGQAFVLQASGRYALSPRFSFELRAPLVLGSVAQPAGAYVDASALGNPQLGARARLFERASGSSVLSVSTTLELGAPLASHDDNLLPQRLLAVGDGLDGHRRPELFTPGALPLTPSAALRYAAGKWSLDAELRLPLFVRVSEADLPSTARTRGVGLISVTSAEGRYRLAQRLSLAAAAHVAVDIVPPVRRLPGASRFQDFERLSLLIRFAQRAVLAIDLQTAIGGELGGNTVGGGLRFGVAL